MSRVLFRTIQSELESFGFSVVSKDFDRPWGGFLVIDESQAQAFANRFFDGLNVQDLRIDGKLSPKILMVNPDTRLSWQFHHRRAEIWQIYRGAVGIIRSDDDEQGPVEHFNEGDQVRLRQGERHRLIGLADFGVVAEIWQHTEKVPSDEEDIVRVQDDFKRK